MLTQLTITNFGLIDQVSVEFNQQLNILTGETGAGKSILIGALRAVLGEKILSSQIRDKQKSTQLEAVFLLKSKEVKAIEELQDYLSDNDNELIIQRILTPEGRNKIKINGFTITLTQLKTIGNHLVDFHGPHDHQMLLSIDSHLGILDRLINFEKAKSIYQDTFTNYENLQAQLQKLRTLAQSRERELDLLSHQVKELEQVPLDDKQYEELLQEQTKLNNAEKLFEHTNQILNLLAENDDCASEKIRLAFSPMQSLNQVDDKTENLMEFLSQLQDTNENLIAELRDYAQGLSFESQESESINQRCDIYYDIKRKYGPTLSDAKTFYDQAKEKYTLLQDLEHNEDELNKQIEKTIQLLKAQAKVITKKRQTASSSLKKTIEKELTELGIANVQFEVRITPQDFGAQGQDNVEFYISPNAGEDLKPLANIVSSGEAARVMLALKKALIKVDPIPVLIFDEIDAQIGGRLGTVTGQKLREISQNRQVILITHLPQIASFANTHLRITKSVKNNRTITEVSLLDQKSRIAEIAQMMSGEKQSQISIKHAEDLLAEAAK